MVVARRSVARLAHQKDPETVPVPAPVLPVLAAAHSPPPKTWLWLRRTTWKGNAGHGDPKVNLDKLCLTVSGKWFIVGLKLVSKCMESGFN